MLTLCENKSNIAFTLQDIINMFNEIQAKYHINNDEYLKNRLLSIETLCKQIIKLLRNSNNLP